MNITSPPPSNRPAEFLFRGNAVAAAGFLTRIKGVTVPQDANTVTTHGESCLPLSGGVSHSLVLEPTLAFPEFIRHGAVETFVQGTAVGVSTVTTLRASVNSVQVTTSPSPEDQLPHERSVSFQADRLSIAVRSTHPPQGQPSFELIGQPETLNMSLVVTQTSGESTRTPIRLQFDEPLIALRTLKDLDDKFLSDAAFFDEHVSCFPTRRKLIFGKSKVPRTRQGYVVGSIVKQITFGDQVIQGSVLTRPGFGTISFGVLVTDDYSRRIALVRIRFGSDPGGNACFTGIETNGIWT